MTLRPENQLAQSHRHWFKWRLRWNPGPYGAKAHVLFLSQSIYQGRSSRGWSRQLWLTEDVGSELKGKLEGQAEAHQWPSICMRYKIVIPRMPRSFKNLRRDES